MHELTLAAEVISLAEEEMKKAAATALREMEIEIGEGSCVDRDVFEFTLSLALKEAGRGNVTLCLSVVPGGTDILIKSMLVD
ncbi:MAG: hydrogenase maturation nickel metallochaperone HypA [Bacteroidetes bacterium]|nr:hydrogenase maturation nickel metallochaperone HypA [Bacteroidota bacterium]